MSNILHKALQVFNNSNSPYSCVQAQLNNNPSHSPSIPLPTSPSQDIPENILAFCTITRLLSQIQQEWAFQVLLSEVKLLPDEHLELKLSNTFSTVAVIEHEVVAVVTKHTHEMLKVIACTQTSINEEPLVTPLPSGLMSQVWQLLVTQNYQKNGPQLTILPTGEPTISNANILAGIDLDDDEKLKLEVDQYLSHSMMAKHLWILSKLIIMKEPSIYGPKRNPSSVSERLLHYPYIQSLKQVMTFQFDESKLDQASKDETANNKLFLIKFMLSAVSRLHTKVPKLMEQAKVAKDNKAFQFYTKDTCTEFHELLVELLLHFQESLDELAKARGNAKSPTKASDEFKQKVELIMLCGYGLQRLAKGAALRMHLKTTVLYSPPPVHMDSTVKMLVAGYV
ncbi:hypothetical protein BDZ97DRAFT_1929731 [Flammula alnicola]|nr:hypothetical protein BDZ97DRAFT_1929731 [Flammula alnicola]